MDLPAHMQPCNNTTANTTISTGCRKRKQFTTLCNQDNRKYKQVNKATAQSVTHIAMVLILGAARRDVGSDSKQRLQAPKH